MKEQLQNPVANFILSMLIPLIALSVAWGIWTTKVNHLERLTIGLQDQYSAQQATNTKIQVTLAEIQQAQIAMQRDILYIRQGLDKHLNQ